MLRLGSLLSFLAIIIFVSSGFAAEAPSVLLDSYHGGSLEDVGGLPILTLRGKPKEMGEQYGYLAGDRVAGVIKQVKKHMRTDPDFKQVPKLLLTPLIRTLGFAFWTQFPKETKQLLKGLIKGAKKRKNPVHINKWDVAFMTSLIDVAAIIRQRTDTASKILRQFGFDKFAFNCDTFAAWGPRTIDGKTFQTRNTDVTLGSGLELYPLVIVYKPHNRIPYVATTFAGQLGIFAGMNAYGVAIGQVWAFSKKTALGTPWSIQMREVLGRATSAAEAVEVFRHLGNRTYGSNFVFADGKGEGYAVEVTPLDFVSFRDDDPKEDLAQYNGEPYGIRLKNVVFRGDVALDPGIRSYQTAGHGPTGDPRTAKSYQRRYKGQSDLLEKFWSQGVKIGKEQAEFVSRSTAMPGDSLQCAVYANTDRKLWVSYAQVQPDGTIKEAYQNEYKEVDFRARLLQEGW